LHGKFLREKKKGEKEKKDLDLREEKGLYKSHAQAKLTVSFCYLSGKWGRETEADNP
jgi:hypothetical protein